MKVQAMHSALAVRRQRNRQEKRRQDKERRESGDYLSTPRDSIVSLESGMEPKLKSKSMFGQVTMFHVGGVFILIGVMLVFTGLLPKVRDNEKIKNQSLGTGSAFIFIGGLLTTISRFISNNEDRELNEYIQSRLARSKSGHKLLRQNSCIMLTPSREKKFKSQHNGVSSNTLMTDLSSSHHHRHGAHGSKENIPPLKPHRTTGVEHEIKETQLDLPISPSEEDILSKILEEDEIELEERSRASPVKLGSTPDLAMTSKASLLKCESSVLLQKRRKSSCPRVSSNSSQKNTKS